MSTYTQDQLAAILADHRAWLAGEKGIEARAVLTGAVLTGADIRSADLTGADLRSADLTGADLRSATMPAGYRWEAYLADVVPALLTAGGTPLADVLAALKARGGWAACHQWSNCPLHEAFGADGLDGVPPLYRWEAAQFVQLFDAGLIPEPTWPGEAALAARGGEGVGNG